MTAPRETTDIRTDVSVSIAQNHAIGAVRAIQDAMWWDEEVHLHVAQDHLEAALAFIKNARGGAAERARRSA